MPTTAVTGASAAVIERAAGSIDRERVAELIERMTAIPSPTGEELALAEFVAGHLRDAGVEAEVQRAAETGVGVTANVIGRLRGTGGGPTLMLYAPLDAAFAPDVAESAPWLGTEPRADFALPPRREGDKIVGLGAENPKAFAAAGIAAVEALAATGVGLSGDVILALCGGSMPVNERPGSQGEVVGHGVGVRHFLASQHPRPDAAIVLKPGYAVSHEEVGLAWFRITVGGAINYTGIRHKGPYRDPIIAAARVVTRLEAWFGDFTDANRAGLVAPQGSINAIHAGSPDRASFIPATAQIDLDLRVAPDSSPDDVQRQLETALDAIRADEPDFEISLERTAAQPGTRTDPNAPIVRSLIGTWERFEGKEHATLGNQSGASDAATIRTEGIPTARIGLPPPATPSPYPGFSMGVADLDSTVRLARLLVHAIADATASPGQEATAP